MLLLELSQDPSNGPAEFARPIEADPGLMAQILRFVNSSYFGFTREITSIRQRWPWWVYEPLRTLRCGAVFSLVPDPKIGLFDLKGLWQDSLRRAGFARILGHRSQLANAEELFAAALLQDIAIPLLLKELPEQYGPLLHRRVVEQIRLSQLERETFGWDHAQVAGALVRRWRLPSEFANLIEGHANRPSEQSLDPLQVDVACVALASLLPSCQDQCWHDREQFCAAIDRWRLASSSDIQQVLTESDRDFANFAPLLQLPVPSVSLMQWYEASQ